MIVTAASDMKAALEALINPQCKPYYLSAGKRRDGRVRQRVGEIAAVDGQSRR
jgi:hypothetical protein